jgi:hypothetical protein
VQGPGEGLLRYLEVLLLFAIMLANCLFGPKSKKLRNFETAEL